MGFLYAALVFSFIILLLVNIVWSAYNLYLFAITGIQNLLKGTTFVENVYLSTYLKWILLADGIWWLSFFIFLIQRHKQTKSYINYLQYEPIIDPKICVVIHVYNEEQVIEKVITDFKSQKNVEYIVVIDNHSTDATVEIAKRCGVIVISKDENKGYAHSWVMGQRESLKTDANVIVITDADGTFSAYDIEKMIQYLNNSDMVVGSRMIQVLCEKDNQNNMFLVWGNNFIGRLLQIKFFTFGYISLIPLTDVGCSYRCFRRETLEKIIEKYTYKDGDKPVFGVNDTTIGLFTTTKVLENRLRVVEIPITFKRRIGHSKMRADKKRRAIKFGLQMIWYVIRS